MSAMTYDIWQLCPSHSISVHENDFLNYFKAWGSSAEVQTVLKTPISIYVFYVICHISMLSYDIFCHLCHMSAMTYDIWQLYHMTIWVSREPSGPQQCSPWLYSHSKGHFHAQKLKKPRHPISPLKFSISFVKCTSFVGVISHYRDSRTLWISGIGREGVENHHQV